MLRDIRLTNFRRHEALHVDFTDGINVLRAANEGGKSTLLESISYALFGTKALRTSLEQAVTWGEDLKTLKVELTLVAGGKTYTYKRSKSGAEVVLNGQVFCTGQNEVSSLSATLLGADANTAQNLLMASQGAIRGSLEQGPKALSLLIEELAGFSTFDQILEAAQEKLVLGSPGMIEERLKGAESTLTAATESLPPKPDDKGHEKVVCTLQTKLRGVEQGLPTLLATARAAEKKWKDASGLYLKKNVLEVVVTNAAATMNAAKAQVDVLAPAANRTFDMRAIQALEQSLVHAQDHAKRTVAYDKFKALPDGERWGGDDAHFRATLAANRADWDKLTAEHGAVEREIASLTARRINHDKCDKCGQDVTHLETVVKTNAEVDAALAGLQPKLARLQSERKMLQNILAELEAVRAYADKFQQAAYGLGDYVVFKVDTWPNTVTWNGPVPEGKAPDVTHLQSQLSAAKSTVKEIESAKAKLELALEQAEKAEGVYSQALQACNAFDAPDADTIIALTEAKDEALLAHGAAQGDVLLIKDEIARLVSAHTSAATLWAMAQTRVDDARQLIAKCKTDLESLGFNNALVKKLRAIRPVIANKLWGTVLASVSVMFSQMRGEESWVSKEKDGFKVNGQAIESLSGSTLDVLGLAIRCALVRTFLPQCGLLVLDEPCAAMDASRTEALLGFLKSVDFQQTLLVSHEEVSESVADNLIQL